MKLYCPECKTIYEDEEFESCPEDGARLFTLETEIDDPLLDATIDGRFRIDSRIGQGGMGSVYCGTQLSVGRQVAIKVLRDELLDREVALERFWRESKIISELTHPNIVRLIDFGQDRERDLLYLAMELVDGFNLGDLLERGRLRIAMALEIVYQVCGALTEPHARDVIHRDLKPDNLLLVPVSDGTVQVKVLDFGIARAMEANTQLTATGMVCGTPQYMAPEQAQNQSLGPPTDLYALGIILYEMLCGIPPFTGNNSLQIMLQQIQTVPAPISQYLPPSALPDQIEDLVKDMLTKQPSGRPQSAREVRDRIDVIRRAYDIDPVRLDPDVARDVMFDDWILESLPSGGEATDNTEALRRETGMGKAANGSTHSTGDALAPALTTADDQTVPVSEAARRRIKEEDARTSRYTPDDQTSAPSEAPSSESSGAQPSPPPAAADSGHMVEDAPAPKDSGAARAVDSTQPAPGIAQASPSAPPSSEEDNRTLFVALGVITVGIILAGVAVVALVFSSTGKSPEESQDGAREVVAAETTIPSEDVVAKDTNKEKPTPTPSDTDERKTRPAEDETDIPPTFDPSPPANDTEEVVAKKPDQEPSPKNPGAGKESPEPTEPPPASEDKPTRDNAPASRESTASKKPPKEKPPKRVADEKAKDAPIADASSPREDAEETEEAAAPEKKPPTPTTPTPEDTPKEKKDEGLGNMFKDIEEKRGDSKEKLDNYFGN